MSLAEIEPPEEPREPPSRSDELSLTDSLRDELEELYDRISKGFDDQRERSDNQMDLWEVYFCQLGRYQQYTGQSQLYWPIVRNAIEALCTRYVNQAFPTSGRHVECVTGEETQPYALISLIEHYISHSRLRTNAARELLIAGQIEGQYNACFRWESCQRTVVQRHIRPMETGLGPHPTDALEIVVEEDIEDAYPSIEVLHDSDVVVLPATACSVEQALEMGGSATILRRWTKAQIERLRDSGELEESEADDLIAELGQSADDTKTRNAARKLAHHTGIHYSQKKFFAVAWETWTRLEIDGETKLCRIFFSGERKVVGAKRNPYWNDRCPLHSAPVKKLPGVLKGESPVAATLHLQVLANDMANEAADMMYYTLAPVLVADPERVTRWRELVADVAAVWPAPPDAMKMLEWPNRALDAMQIISAAKAQIFETLGVSPGMLPQQTGAAMKGGKRNQAEIALEQQVELLQTADAVTVFEEEILTPFVQWCADLDHQFREKDILVREFGELGLKAGLEEIPPTQSGRRYRFRWSGVESARNLAAIQQQIALLNVVKQIPPQLYQGYRLNLAPFLERTVGTVLGPQLGRLTFVSLRDEQGLDPQVENRMLVQGFDVQVHMADNDRQHVQAHMTLPPSPARDMHIKRHQLKMQAQQAAQMQQMMAQQGGPPGAGGRPGGPGGPGMMQGPGARPGAQPAQGRPAQGPAGMIHQDRLPGAGAIMMPRKF